MRPRDVKYGMHRFRLLLLALFFALSASASAVASVHSCCAKPDCDIAHCIDMGCAAALPVFAVDTTMMPRPVAAGENHVGAQPPRPPDLYEEVWTPPD